jgi:pentatricopeptide repeat protein
MKADELPTDLQILLESVRGKLELGLYKEAWHDLQLVPESVRDHLLVLDYSFWAADWLEYTEPAKELALKLMKLEPKSGHRRHCYGILVMKTQGPEEAMPWYNDALRLSPDDQTIYVSMIDCLLAQGRVEEARQFLLKTIERFPKQRYFASTRPAHAKLLLEPGQEEMQGFASPKACRACNRAIHGEAEIRD